MKSQEQWLQDPGLFATSAIAILLDRWGTEFIEWDPVTVGAEIEREFGISPTSLLQDRIQAASSLLTSNLFFVNLETFMVTCDALNFGAPASELLVPADLDDVLWGVSEAWLLLGEDMDFEEFNSDISTYIGVLLGQEGLSEAPSVLKFAEPSIQKHDTTPEEDDEILFKARFDSQKEDIDSLEAENNKKLFLLMRQLAMLPLQSGNTDSIREKLKRNGVTF